MALSYTLTNMPTFSDSQYSTAANITAIKSLVNQVVDKRYHRQVWKKQFYKRLGLIGADTYSEGDSMSTSPGVPVLRKTELQAVSGDVIKMGLRRNVTSTHKTGGKVGDAQLVDNETNWDWYNKKVSIDRWREAVRTYAGMNRKRNPYEDSLEQIEEDQLSQWSADKIDTSILYAQWCGNAPHMIRQHGVTNQPVTANPNTLFGNDKTLDTTRTIGNIVGDGSDNVKGITFEIGCTYLEQIDADPVLIDGQPFWVAMISPKARLILYRDAEFRDAAKYARERGNDNILFKYADFLYGNCIVYTYDKIRTILGGNNPAGITVSSNEITEAAYTGIGDSVASTNLHQTLFLGANAVALAEGSMRMAERKEDDYGNVIGRAVDMIFGVTRMDWKSEDGNTTSNQSSLCIVNTVLT